MAWGLWSPKKGLGSLRAMAIKIFTLTSAPPARCGTLEPTSRHHMAPAPFPALSPISKPWGLRPVPRPLFWSGAAHMEQREVPMLLQSALLCGPKAEEVHQSVTKRSAFDVLSGLASFLGGSTLWLLHVPRIAKQQPTSKPMPLHQTKTTGHHGRFKHTSSRHTGCVTATRKARRLSDQLCVAWA